METFQEKICSICFVSKNINEFNLNKKLKFGVASKCKICAREKEKEICKNFKCSQCHCSFVNYQKRKKCFSCLPPPIFFEDSENNLKTCRSCLKKLNVSNFCSNKSMKDNLSIYCKPCSKIKNKSLTKEYCCKKCKKHFSYPFFRENCCNCILNKNQLSYEDCRIIALSCSNRTFLKKNYPKHHSRIVTMRWQEMLFSHMQILDTGGYSRGKFKKDCLRNNNGFGLLYLIRCYNQNENFYKIGRTSLNIHGRFNCKRRMPYSYEVLKTYTALADLVFDLEYEIKAKFKSFLYNPKINFKGSLTECFYVNKDLLNCLSNQ